MVSEGKSSREGKSALGFPGAEGYIVLMGSAAVKLGLACEFGVMLRAAGDLCLCFNSSLLSCTLFQPYSSLPVQHKGYQLFVPQCE